MSKNKTELEKAIGQLISNIQKIWSDQIGEPEYEISEKMMYRAYDLYQQKVQDLIISEQYTVMSYLGKKWISHHRELWALLKRIESLIKENNHT